MNITEVLRKRKEEGIFKVNLVGSKDCLAFWDEYINCVYHNKKLELLNLDVTLQDTLYQFKNSDTLELVNKHGRLLKRFSKFYKSFTGNILSNEVMGILGDCLQTVSENSTKEFFVDIVDKFDWCDGEFGKGGSCWWGQYRMSLPVFQDNGGWCIRFYDINNSGIGRTWLYPVENGILGFNSYGVERNKVSKILKSIFLESGIDLFYTNCSIYNRHNDNIPYINSGTGFVLCQVGYSAQESYDLDMEIPDGMECCRECGEMFSFDDGGGVVNGYSYCDICLSENFSFCDRCNEYENNDEVHGVQGHSRYNWLCEDCADYIGISRCDVCEDYTENCFHFENTGNVYCESCVPNYFYCEVCETDYEGETECPNCEVTE